MHLIADSGSTKTAWRLIKDINQIISIETIGYSPQYISTEEMIADLKVALLPKLTVSTTAITKISFYGTGCSTPRTVDIIKSALEHIFEHSIIEVNHDLFGAARALCGHEAGVACILGTGSNSCLFDGEKINDNIPSVGFMLGDEGSGGYLGKKLVRAYFYRELPEELSLAFANKYNLSRDEMLLNVYKQPAPNRYLASFSIFLSEYITHPFIQEFVQKGFQAFLEAMVLKYDNVADLQINFLGSIAVHFQPQLEIVLKHNNLKIGKVVDNPVDELVKYHLLDN